MFIKPEEIIKNFEIRNGMVVVDFGSGSGHYVLAAAKKMNNSGLPAGQAGVVYAIDIQKNLLETIKSEAVKQHLSNVDIIWADIEGKEGLNWPAEHLILLSLPIFCSKSATKQLWSKKF